MCTDQMPSILRVRLESTPDTVVDLRSFLFLLLDFFVNM